MTDGTTAGAPGDLAAADEPAGEAPRQALTLSCVILTMGDRPAEVNRAIDSVLTQRGAQVKLVVVGNGAEVTGLPAGGRTVLLPENVGVAAGRDAGEEAGDRKRTRLNSS